MLATSDQIEIEKVLAMGKQCACFNLRKAARAVTRFYDDVLRSSGLRVTQFTLLSAVKVLQPVTVKRLAKATVMDRTTLGRNLKPLKNKGLIRIESGKDHRERNVYLTAEGQGLIAETYPVWEQVQEGITQKLGPERFERFLSDLAFMVKITRKT
jgi:DNA-binding MarR family transcriptional regulator